MEILTETCQNHDEIMSNLFIFLIVMNILCILAIIFCVYTNDPDPLKSLMFALGILVFSWVIYFTNGFDIVSGNTCRYEVLINENEMSNETYHKLLENYEVEKKTTFNGITKATIRGPEYASVFTEDEVKNIKKKE